MVNQYNNLLISFSPWYYIDFFNLRAHSHPLNDLLTPSQKNINKIKKIYAEEIIKTIYVEIFNEILFI